MKRVKIYGLLLSVLLLAVSGCAARAPRPSIVEKEVPVERFVVVEKEVAREVYALSNTAAGGPVAERMIIRTANLFLTVKDTAKSVEDIKAIVNGLGGFVVSSNAWRVDKQLRANMTVRVPAQSFDAAMSQIKGLATVVEREETSGQDVTEEYTDLDARLRTLEATEKELLELLAQTRERSSKAEDILAVYRELTNIRSQIEQLKGRMQYLERMTAMATIHLNLQPDVVAEPIAQTGWRPGATAAGALQRLVRTLQGLADLLINFVLYIAPILILLALPLVVLILLIRWWLQRRKASQA